jgi:hypothetical protein
MSEWSMPLMASGISWSCLEMPSPSFATMPYGDLVKWVKKLDQSVTHFTTTDPWASKTTEVR